MSTTISFPPIYFHLLSLLSTALHLVKVENNLLLRFPPSPVKEFGLILPEFSRLWVSFILRKRQCLIMCSILLHWKLLNASRPGGPLFCWTFHVIWVKCWVSLVFWCAMVSVLSPNRLSFLWAVRNLPLCLINFFQHSQSGAERLEFTVVFRKRDHHGQFSGTVELRLHAS